MIVYRSGRETQAFIRVWRSLVSRLNGVQEASSSNLDTRTKKQKQFLLFLLFYLCRNLSINCNTPGEYCTRGFDQENQYFYRSKNANEAWLSQLTFEYSKDRKILQKHLIFSKKVLAFSNITCYNISVWNQGESSVGPGTISPEQPPHERLILRRTKIWI